MNTVFITLAWSLFVCAIVCVVVLVAQAVNEQRRSRSKSVTPPNPLRQQTYVHPPQSSQGRKPAPYRYILPSKQGKDLRQATARSQTASSDRSEYGKNARQHQRKTSASPQQPVDDQLRKRLFILVNGDMKTANRLLEHTRQSNSLQSEQWVWEKVIYDLERDRT